MEAYCLSCKTTREIQDPKPVVFKNKMKAEQGTCPVCGKKIQRIVGKAE